MHPLIESDAPPLGWATVTYQRDHVDTIEGESHIESMWLTRHACVDCYDEVLAFLDQAEPPSASEKIDSAFDDGGEA
jgi:hypothetical protein